MECKKLLSDGKKDLLSGRVLVSVRDEFKKTVPKGSTHGATLEAAAKLWISLPEEARVRLVSQTMTEDAFIELLHQIVDEKIEEGRLIARSQSQRPKQ